jgi:hypothetical protein
MYQADIDTPPRFCLLKFDKLHQLHREIDKGCVPSLPSMEILGRQLFPHTHTYIFTKRQYITVMKPASQYQVHSIPTRKDNHGREPMMFLLSLVGE